MATLDDRPMRPKFSFSHFLTDWDSQKRLQTLWWYKLLPDSPGFYTISHDMQSNFLSLSTDCTHGLGMMVLCHSIWFVFNLPCFNSHNAAETLLGPWNFHICFHPSKSVGHSKGLRVSIAESSEKIPLALGFQTALFSLPNKSHSVTPDNFCLTAAGRLSNCW